MIYEKQPRLSISITHSQ